MIKLRNLSPELRSEIEKISSIPANLSDFATLEMLSDYATKEEIEGFTTQSDLEALWQAILQMLNVEIERIFALENGGPIQPFISSFQGFLTERRVFVLDGSNNAVNWTDFSPTNLPPGTTVLIVCTNADNAVTVKCGTGVTFDGTNNTATFGANKALWLCAVSDTRWLVCANIGSVTFSST